MIGKVLLALCALFITLSALPWKDRVVLANSLIVGRSEDLELWICATCDDSNKPLHAHNIYHTKSEIKSVLSVYPEFVVLAFRYTANALNLWQDLLYPFQRVDENTCKKCKVQGTYNKMWNKIQANVTRDLLEIRAQTGLNKLYISGISLGGALAGLAFIDLEHNKVFDDIKVITFGSPRVGNKRWAKHFDSLTNGESRRYLIKGDPITILPACITFFCGYRHAGVKIVCNKKKQTCVQTHEIDDVDIFGRMMDTYESITDMDEDIKNIKDVEGLIDHIYGYPKIDSFSLIMNGRHVTE